MNLDEELNTDNALATAFFYVVAVAAFVFLAIGVAGYFK